ncbi:gamma-glutamyl-gamma-aminobutyrate hydrolase family protein [Actinosynnema sp. NPDC051121]
MALVVGISQRLVPARGEEVRDSLDQRWTTLLESLGFDPVPLPTLVADPVGYVVRRGIRALVLSGGENVPATGDSPPWNEPRDVFERTLLVWAMANGVPVLAVCRGFQLVVADLGGVLRRVDGHAGSMHPLRWSAGEPGPATVLSHHDWAVTRLPHSLREVALATDGTVEAARHRDLPLLGIMWHPERTPNPDEREHALVSSALKGLG